MCDIYDFDSFIINVSIRISKIREFRFDIIFINVFAFVKDSGIIYTSLSDYDFVYTVLKIRYMRLKVEIIIK